MSSFEDFLFCLDLIMAHLDYLTRVRRVQTQEIGILTKKYHIVFLASPPESHPPLKHGAHPHRHDSIELPPLNKGA